MQNEPIERIKELAYPIAEQRDTFLVDVEIKHHKIPEIWIYVDAQHGGVELDTCSAISREIGRALDKEDIFANSYRLNVSSPGLSRPLSDWRQYGKNKGRTAKVKFKTEDQYKKIEGTIEAVENEKITLSTGDGDNIDIEFSDIVETKIIPKI